MPSRVDYRRRFERVVRYIYEHLDEELDLNRLAEVACLSSYHWHRVYHALTGETVAATVRRLRLQRAAAELAKTTTPVVEIAKRCGYTNLQSFTRTFKAAYGLPPARYRQCGSHTQFDLQHSEEALIMHEVTIKTIDAINTIGLEHHGSYMNIGQTFDTLFAELGERGLFHDADALRAVGVYYDDPNVVAEAQLRARAAVVLPSGATGEDTGQLRNVTIAAGRYAVMRHKGPYSDTQAAYNWLFGEWLVNSGRTLADAPTFEEYLNDPKTTPPTELLTEIYLPLRD